MRAEEVFKVSGVPEATFVEPSAYVELQVALRTSGRPVVVEGPSGIGKSTAVSRALTSREVPIDAVTLSARIPGDVQYIELLPELTAFGTVIIDDFHRLRTATRSALADLMKTLADSEDPERKLIAIGINQAGYSLIHVSPDLANRLDVIRFEIESPYKIEELISKGEDALNIRLSSKPEIIENSFGSFYIAQLLSLQTCIAGGVQEKASETRDVHASFSAVRKKVVAKQADRFGAQVKAFARGTKFRPSGRAPYFHILSWLAEADSWAIALPDETAKHPSERISVGQVVDKGYLANLIKTNNIDDILHFDSETAVLSVEDPHLIFYLKSIDWPQFVRELGFTKVQFEETYDVALSFAGEDRAFAEALYEHLSDAGWAVFYDLAEKHRILANRVDKYLAPIYQSNAQFVVAVLGEQYGMKRWTIFESEQFKSRIDAGEVIPIRSTRLPMSAFDATRDIGHLTFNPAEDPVPQAIAAADDISQVLEDRRHGRLFAI